MSVIDAETRLAVPPREPDHGPPWEQLGPPPHAPLRAAIAERAFRHAVRSLPVQIALAGGERLGTGESGSPLMRVHRPAAFFHRLGHDGKIGFGEAYLAGDWTSPEPAELLTPFAAKMADLIPRPLQAFRGFVDTNRPASERNTERGARENIRRHYDFSNTFFASFLDPAMTYSGAPLCPGGDLAEAQDRKLAAVLDLAGVREGSRLLEIGTGWGSLAVVAAGRGAHVTTLTLSAEQRKLAEERIARAGLADRVDIRLRDYREEHGRYDAVVSVEMIEAVGAQYWPTFFRQLDRLLLPGGKAAVQAITMPHDRLLATRESQTWIHKYVFPGGQLPSVKVIERNVAANTGMTLVERRAFGSGYAETLRQWRQRLNANWPVYWAGDGRPGTDGELPRRMWEFYLAYSEAGFRSGYLDVCQFGLHKPVSR
ncbi:cyclopropane-fatty-acyl-phospholipid synthase [Prauserella marina]|uniref:Cyclopropane-fatty-acyl-phospholipid synthase n=1 Tax=Prauserella marina TaxID=530584 RepID=A0A222VKV0_9PSEU|nr:cyclopropane-fatty-acyl-phospholipid synthase family protein [Prauserella marina]ASR34550.1 cyclopropane-fatty-acyl-phospholipid synthase [Prauserella marina]PWV85837.1 cyclopropane-fatty-acyl-phospholipid synthase [Prauserella marina]SDC44295.1 cyclopropane-fatty-acyl-phospholipid synthase [Prauserella marina]